MLLHNLKQLAIAFDQLINALACLLLWKLAWADETLSAHAWRMDRAGVASWPRKIIDALLWFDKDHCRTSYESERLGRQLPPEMRPKRERMKA